MRTDTGRVREHNEDFITSWEPATAEDEARNGWLYIVADGVGGADAGEVASQYASERTTAHFLANLGEADWGRRLVQAMQAANTDLRQLVAERSDKKRMATTMVTAVIQGQHAVIANVGDSRGYHWRDSELTQITKDQSLVAKLLEEGAISEEEAVNHPHKNVILYSLGSEKTPRIDLFPVELKAGDMIVLCSDGLTRHVSDEEICQAIGEAAPGQATESLINLANGRGGQDNISVAVLRFGMRESEQFASPSAETVGGTPVSPNRRALWLLTIFLSLTQTILIFIVWILLRV